MFNLLDKQRFFQLKCSVTIQSCCYSCKKPDVLQFHPKKCDNIKIFVLAEEMEHSLLHGSMKNTTVIFIFEVKPTESILASRQYS